MPDHASRLPHPLGIASEFSKENQNNPLLYTYKEIDPLPLNNRTVVLFCTVGPGLAPVWDRDQRSDQRSEQRSKEIKDSYKFLLDISISALIMGNHTSHLHRRTRDERKDD